MEEDDLKLDIVAYKIMADSAEKTSDRRQAANTFFITISLALAAAYTFLIKADAAGRQLIWPTAIVGVAVCALWALTLWYYRSLSTAKFQLLGEFEVEHGVTGYQREWELFSARHPFGKVGFSLAGIEFFFAVATGFAHVAAGFLLQNVHVMAN